MVINTVEVINKPIEGTAAITQLEKKLREIGVTNANAFSTTLYTLAGDISEEELKKIPELVHHPVTEKAIINAPLDNGQGWDFAIRVDFKPGVTDNAARILSSDMNAKKIQSDVYTSKIHYIKGEFNLQLKEMLERVASNPQIQDITMLTKQEFEKKNGFENKIHPVNLGNRPNFFYVDIGNMSRDELLKTGKKGTLNTSLVKPGMTPEKIDELRGGTLALEEDYLNVLLDYANSELNTIGGNKKGVLTDTELELIAQMWSEHCRHSLYNASIPEDKKGIFTKYIKAPTLEVLKEKPHLGLSIFKDNSGVFKFNDKWLVCVKNETHNSPSALDPYGGAITGIVGVNRDPAGTGVGAEVIGNFQFYRFGHLNDRRKYFKTKKQDATLENLLLNPRQIADGVWDGVEAGGNQMGIPVNIGNASYHDNYNGKPIVGVGSIGRLPHLVNGNPSYEKHIDVGDLAYICGGRAGKDGIHGATFSSEELSANSPATAVQIGDAYTQRKLFEALLEARDAGLINFVTDLGAGGTCCAVMEMAEETGGIEMNLDKLLIKYEGMTATELLLNESQERMAVAVNPAHAAKFEAIMKKHETEYSDIGTFNNSGRAKVYCKEEKVVDMDMNFIHKGMPQRELKPANYKLSDEQQRDTNISIHSAINKNAYKSKNKAHFVQQEFDRMHERPNLASTAGFCDKMDSTVKGLQVQHSIQGRGRVSTQTACTLVDTESDEGLIQAYGHAERQTYIDAEKHGKNSFLRAIGNNIAMGGRLDYMIATDQALWQSSDKGEFQQMLIEANRGMASVTTGCKIPVISGKDSMYNQATVYAEDGSVVKRGIFPEIQMITFAKIDNANNIVTIDAKREGDLIYVVGAKTKADLGGSEYINMYAEQVDSDNRFGKVSSENIDDVFDTFQKMNNAQSKNLLQSATYIEAGGLAIALRNTAMAGEIGLKVNIRPIIDKQEVWQYDQVLFSETEGRFLVTIRPEDKVRFEKIFEEKHYHIGAVKGKDLIIANTRTALITKSVEDMLSTYHKGEA